MGCCLSSNNNKRGSSSPEPLSHRHSPPQPRKPHVSTASASPPPEEETVKEVLSETPIILEPQMTTTQNQEPKTLMQRNSKKHQEDQEISQASETCSTITATLTPTTSTTSTTATTTTTTITEIREDEVTSMKRVNRSVAKVHRKRPYTGDRERVLKYPAKTTGQVIRTAAGQRNAGSRGVRNDFGRSTATRTAGGAGSGRAGASPGKAGDRSVERKNKEDSENGSVFRQQEGNESLENPLVSLECFIFL
ncbi:PREDICTED: uncharacterized protein LOC105124096 [Populus euphratica]|uniref:Uncharacterized protein LOC105124096 n=1 Tax=Populus euphratica TaxID=75702 RepID=A0AAJ6U4P2_POPEU|nr:PREDICTED: uncharacterized protein LOC105124096 [Populus euphratica]